jgi:uncharacterized protein YjbI with pentapeptide repeats
MSDEVQRPTSEEDRKGWEAYWVAHGMPWRTEPEIDEERQYDLAQRRTVQPDVERGIYPFRDEQGPIALSRADVEWLLAMHESAGLRGPLNWHDPSQWNRAGPDLRGADVRDVDLHGLPLARLRGGLTGAESLTATDAQRDAAVMRGTRALLYAAHLEGGVLTAAHLEGADLYAAHLEGADLYEAHVEGADLRTASFDGASNLNHLRLTDEAGVGPLLRDVHWNGVNLSGVAWAQVRMLGEEREAQQLTTADGRQKDVDGASRHEAYERAVRANRQLAATLRGQGLTEAADRFAYRAQLCQRQVYRAQGRKSLPAYAGSLFLWALSGYGYRVGRILATYGVVLAAFTLVYAVLGVHSFRRESGAQALWDAFLVSLSAVHGRTTFEQLGAWTPAAWTAAVESVVGIVIEGVFVAMLIQRLFAR